MKALKSILLVSIMISLVTTLVFVALINHIGSDDAAVVKVLAQPHFKLKVLTVNIVNITNTTITLEDNTKLIVIGKWLLLSNDGVKIVPWSYAMRYIKNGNARIIFTVLEKNNKVYKVLLALLQNENFVVRPIFFKRMIYKHKHGTFEFACRVIGKYGYYLIAMKKGISFMILTNPNGKWLKVGEGDVYWKDIVKNFEKGDRIWICVHNILLLREPLAKLLGVSAVVWGFSGAIANIDKGFTLLKYPI